jgi:site-specific DNA recombinase
VQDAGDVQNVVDRAAVRVVLTNPRYTGRQVWNKQRKDEVLIDVDDVALGHETRLRWNTPAAWVWSAQVVHEPLVSDEDFQRVQNLLASKKNRQTQITTIKRTRHPYQLRGLLFCGICHRRMQGSWNNDKPHYRCVYPIEYGLANHTQHPRSIYVREELIIPTLDQWLLRAFSPAELPHTIQALADAQDESHDDEQPARTAEAERIITDCDQRLARYRAALEAGTDPTLIARWTAEVNTTRAAAQAQLRTATAGRTRMTPAEINSIISALGNILDVLHNADPADKAKIYSGVGLKLTYQPAENKSDRRGNTTGDHVRRFVSEGSTRTNSPWRWRTADFTVSLR